MCLLFFVVVVRDQCTACFVCVTRYWTLSRAPRVYYCEQKRQGHLLGRIRRRCTHRQTKCSGERVFFAIVFVSGGGVFLGLLLSSGRVAQACLVLRLTFHRRSYEIDSYYYLMRNRKPACPAVSGCLVDTRKGSPDCERCSCMNDVL